MTRPRPQFPRDRLAGRCYAALLWLAPPLFRREYGAIAVEDVRARADDIRRAAGSAAAGRYWLRQYGDLIVTMLREWADVVRPSRLEPNHRLPGSLPAREMFSMDTVLSDLRYSIRALLKQPAFTAIVVLTLALGIGANTAIFSILDAVVLRPLPYDDPDELVLITDELRAYEIANAPLAPYEARTLFENSRLFDALVASTGPFQAPLSDDGGDPEQIQVMNLSPGFIGMLGVAPMVGRDFTLEESEALDPAVLQDPNLEMPPSVALLDHDFWSRRFGSDASVVGRDITINARKFEVIGVMPPGFRIYVPGLLGGQAGNVRTDVYTPLQVDYSQPTGAGFLSIFGRMADGVSLQQGNAEVAAIAAELRESHDRSRRGQIHTVASAWGAEVSRDVRPALLALLGAVGFVLLISCANVANLLLARAASRRQEVAVRAALGARRGRIIRQVLTESLLLAGGGAALGLLMAMWGVGAILTLQPDGIPRAETVAINGAVLGFTVIATLAAVVLFGVVPAMTLSRVRGNLVLNERGTGGGSRGRSRLRNALVVAEVALSLVLLVGAGLMLRSFSHLNGIDPGFRPESVTTFQVALPFVEYRDTQSREAFFEELLRRVEPLNGVESFSGGTALPLSGAVFAGSFYTADMDREQPGVEANYRGVGPNYFRTMGTPVLQGREFDALDDNPNLVIVDQQLAEFVFPGESAVGQTLNMRLPTFPGGPPANVDVEIVGVVGNVRDDAGIEAPSRRTIYLPHEVIAGGNIAFAMRASVDPDDLLPRVREQIAAIDPTLAMYAVRPMQAYIDDALAPVRFSLILIGLFGTFAMVLAAIGLYGVLSNSVRQQTRDIGVRIAFGASSSQILKQIVARGAGLAALGIVIGMLVAIPLTRALRSLFVGVAPSDPITMIGISALLLGVSVVACFLPALRAARLDPATSLRSD